VNALKRAEVWLEVEDIQARIAPLDWFAYDDLRLAMVAARLLTRITGVPSGPVKDGRTGRGRTLYRIVAAGDL
jgi:hypothetical protein